MCVVGWMGCGGVSGSERKEEGAIAWCVGDYRRPLLEGGWGWEFGWWYHDVGRL